MSEAEDRFPYPPDSVGDVEALANTVQAFGEVIDDVAEGVNAIKSDIAANWTGQAADATVARLSKLVTSLAKSRDSLDGASSTIGSYQSALVATRSTVDTVRGEFDVHWPNGLSQPCVDAAEKQCYKLGDLDFKYRSALDTLHDDADSCRSALDRCMPDRSGLIRTVASLLKLPTGGFLGIGVDDALNDYAQAIMTLGPAELNQWLDGMSDEDIARVAHFLDTDAKVRFASYLLQNADPLLIPKVLAGLPFVNPDPGEGVGWGTPQHPDLLFDESKGHLAIDDLRQKGYGDCWMLASVGAIVMRDPSWPSNHVRQNKNGTITVTFYDKTGKQIDVTVTPEVPTTNGVQPRGAGPGRLDSSGPWWPAYVEKAFAQYYGDGTENWGTYGRIEDDNAGKAVRYLTGNTGKQPDISAAQAVRDYQAGKRVVLGTGDFDPKKLPGTGPISASVYGHHVYVVENIYPPQRDASGHQYGSATVRLHNPWGANPDNDSGDDSDRDLLIPVDQLDKYFTYGHAF